MNYRNCCSFFNANMVLALQPPQGAADEGLRPQQRRSIFITNPFITNEGLDLLARLLSEDPRNKRTLPPLPPGSGSAHAGVARVGWSHRLTSSAGLLTAQEQLLLLPTSQKMFWRTWPSC